MIEYRNDKGQLHRIDGPAVKQFYAPYDGFEEWWYNGLRHRIDGPAIESDNSKHKEWWWMGKQHRTDGPAVEYNNGAVEWWIDGELLTKKEYLDITINL